MSNCRHTVPYLEFVDPRVAHCVKLIEDMGFDNCNGWITELSVKYGGDVSQVIEALPQDPVYAERMKKGFQKE